jgi:hypothetical protein
MRIIFTRIGCTLLMCDMYMSDLRYIHDPVLSSLKMEGIRLLYFLCSLTLPTTRSRICAYVTFLIASDCLKNSLSTVTFL